MVKLGGNYVKTADVNDGDVINFMDEGEWIKSARWTYEDGSPKMDFVIGVEIKGETKQMRLNKTNRDILTEAYGNDTVDWIGKSAKITKEKCLVAGKKMDCIILVVPGSAEGKPEGPLPDQEIPF